jgi:L-alanine-DL-glutamate epimerase-like enolase superfamily enzyme
MSTSSPAPLTLRVAVEKWPLKEPFHITGYTMVDTDLVLVTLEQDGLTGRGEAAGVYYFNDDTTAMVTQIQRVRSVIEAGIDREGLQQLLPAGGARNALDCALWDLEAQRLGIPAWQIAGLESPVPKITAHTIGAGAPEKMRRSALDYAHAKLIKLKLTGEPEDADRVRRVRAARPDVGLIVDANQGFTRASLLALLPVLIEADVKLIEQPFRIGQEAQMKNLDSPIPFGADESAQTAADVERLAPYFQVINIKLDKSGGLTEALAMVRQIQRLGLDAMIGNMTGTSLGMAPAFLVAQSCKFVDLDGPMFLRSDRVPPVTYQDGAIGCPESLWGGAVARAVTYR